MDRNIIIKPATSRQDLRIQKHDHRSIESVLAGVNVYSKYPLSLFESTKPEVDLSQSNLRENVKKIFFPFIRHMVV